MGIDRQYVAGLIILFSGFILLKIALHFIGAFLIGLGFVLILKSYVK